MLDPVSMMAIAQTASSIFSANQQRKNAKKDAKAAEKAAQDSAQVLAQAGSAADATILDKSLEASRLAGEAAASAEGRLSTFMGTGAYQFAQDAILSGEDLTSPLARSISGAAISAQDPRFADYSGPVGEAAAREAMLGASASLPAFTSNLLGAGQEELGITSDVAGIRGRGFKSLGDIAYRSSGARANALIGQTSQLGDILQSGQEARMFGKLANRNFQNTTVESLASLAGVLRGQGYLGGK